MVAPSSYAILKAEYAAHLDNAQVYRDLAADTRRFIQGTFETEDAPAFLVRLRAAVGTDLAAIVAASLDPGGDAPITPKGEAGGSVLGRLQDLETGEIQLAADLEPKLFDASFEGEFLRDFGPRRTARFTGEFPVQPGSTEPQAFRVTQLDDGTVIRTDQISGEVTVVGSFPKPVAGPPPQIMQRDNGDLVSIDTLTGRATLLQKGFGFAQIDPERTFALEAQRTDVAFKGLELQARGLQVQALGQDFANRIALGRMEYEEAQLNLNRINSAFEVRRQERDVALKFAIASTSIRTLPDGTRVFRSPLAEATARTLGLPEGSLDLPVGVVNPEASAQALLDATQFDSPIPDLQAQADATAAATQALLAAPLQGAPNV